VGSRRGSVQRARSKAETRRFLSVRDVSNFPVMQEKCPTCPFGEAGDLHLRASIEQRVLTSASQTCHHTGAIHGKPDTHLCRGARDFQIQIFYRLGMLREESDEAWKEAVKLLTER
jgi:hypothetical protein